MDIFSITLTILGLSLFETISSIDNAIINAEVLHTMSAKARKWFLLWGLIFAVFLVRGLLPWIIVWATMPELGFVGSLLSTFSSDPKVHESIEKSAPILLMGGGIFLIFLFIQWLFTEQKNETFFYEKYFLRNKVWFYAMVSIILAVIVWHSLEINNMIAFSAILGSTAFFISYGFKKNAEKSEQDMLKGNLSDISKIMYLEVIDMTFSIDGVLGAFAFTLSVPLILLGNGLGAFIVREFTIRNIENIKKYKYLKNGAMYSILVLGLVMVLDAFGHHIPSWFSPVSTFIIIGYFLWKSFISIKKERTN